MCMVKSGKEISNRGDYQNLVIGILLRQRQKFRPSDIVDKVLHYAENSSCPIGCFETENIVDRNIDTLVRINRVRPFGECYVIVP